MSLALRSPAVAGLFYPANARDLAASLAIMLGGAHVADGARPRPKALVVPHAGYIYSGPIAASAYALLTSLRDTIRHVVLLGPCHRVAVRGLAIPSVDAFVTPLGTVPLDRDALDAAASLPQVGISDAAHAPEHSLEVHLPFLQTVLSNFSLAPFAVGQASAQEVAEVLDLLWGGPETLIVISSDLSHYLPYAVAQSIDHQTSAQILQLAPLASHEQACGATPINGLLQVARQRGLTPELLDLRNSGDTAGDKSRVVGYGAFAFSEGADHE